MDRCIQAYCLISFNVWIDIMCTYICTLIPKHFSNSIISDHCFNSNTIQDESTISVLSGLSLTVLASLMLIYFPIYIGILGHYLCVLASLQTCHVITPFLFLLLAQWYMSRNLIFHGVSLSDCGRTNITTFISAWWDVCQRKASLSFYTK